MTDFNEILGDLSKDKFKLVMNRLLNECFILKKAKETASDYRFIKENASVFEGILDLLGYELIIRDDDGVITIYNPAGTGRIQLSKLESILLLLLRLLYIEKMKELSQIDEVIVTVADIYDKYNMLRLPRPRRDLMINSLRTFKRVNIIKNFDRLDKGDMEARIQIYPSVLLAVTSSSLDTIYKSAQEKLKEYSIGGEEDESDNDSPDEELD